MNFKYLILVLLCYSSTVCLNVTVLGTGYVGLVVGPVLAEFGHTVRCVDIDEDKIENLQKGIIPIYEPGITSIIQNNVASKHLSFSADIKSSLQHADVIFITIGTPMMPDGTADISSILSSVDTIASGLDDEHYRLICIKSTVPIETTEYIKKRLKERSGKEAFDVVFNPEFLREGSALQDFLYPDRVVIGIDTNRAQEIMEVLYQPLLKNRVPFIITDPTTAETIKYASNAFLAVKIAYINEIANLCEKTGAHIFDVAQGMGLDTRIGNKFLTPGPGFGGSCFPKDSHALLKKSEEVAVNLHIVHAALEANEFQKKHVVTKLKNEIGDNLSGKTIAVLGLAFKAHTDDIRESAAITVIQELQKSGARVQGYDPLAIDNMKKIIPDIYYAQSLEETLKNCDAAIILTEWDEFKDIRNLLPSHRKQLPIIDTRNILKP